MDDSTKRTCLEILRRANAALALYCQEHEASPVRFNDDDLMDNRLLSEQFQAVQPLLDTEIHRCSEPDIHHEMQLYRDHLLRVRELLQEARRLTTRRVSELEPQRAHLDATRRWCEVLSEQF